MTSWIEPWPFIYFEVLPIENSQKVILEIQVGAGTAHYGCGRPGETGMPYVRHQCDREGFYRRDRKHRAFANSECPELFDIRK